MNDKLKLELMKTTGLSFENLMKEIKPYKTNWIALKYFYLAVGRFPEPREDEFLYEHGFTNWYNAFRSGIFKKL